MAVATQTVTGTLDVLVERARSDFFNKKIKNPKGHFFTAYESSPGTRIEMQVQNDPKGHFVNVGVVFSTTDAEQNKTNATNFEPFIREHVESGLVKRIPNPKKRAVQYFGTVRVSEAGITGEEVDQVFDIAMKCFQSVRAYENRAS